MAGSVRHASVSLLVLFSIALLVPCAHAGSGTLQLQKAASYEKGLKIPDEIRSDCGIATKLVDFIESSVREDYDRIAPVEDAVATTTGKALAVTITGLSGEKGGVWSGPKHLSIAGTLLQDGKVIGTFTANRTTSGGVFGGYRGTCSLLSRCARALGRDVAEWLRKPTMDAVLGDAGTVATVSQGTRSAPTPSGK